MSTAIGADFGAATAEQQARAKPTESTPDLGLRVLIAEDNPVNVMILEITLAELSCEFCSTGNGKDLLAMYQDAAFDIILMDVQMPLLDGLEATKLIRQAESITGSHIPIIALTAHAQQEDRERCLAAGMDDYLAKPIVRGDLIAKLQHWRPTPKHTRAKKDGR